MSESTPNENKVKDETSKQNLSGLSNTKQSIGAKLPWWVELFFVQIGLPENLLVKILQLNKDFKVSIEKNGPYYLLVAGMSIIAIYITPTINNSRIMNQCIKVSQKDLIKNNPILNKSKRDSFIKAVNYCNGGEID